MRKNRKIVRFHSCSQNGGKTMLYSDRKKAQETYFAFDKYKRFLYRSIRNRYIFNWIKNKNVKFEKAKVNPEDLLTVEYIKFDRSELISNFANAIKNEKLKTDFINHLDKARKAANYSLQNKLSYDGLW